jgi:hypothetical protein
MRYYYLHVGIIRVSCILPDTINQRTSFGALILRRTLVPLYNKARLVPRPPSRSLMDFSKVKRDVECPHDGYHNKLLTWQRKTPGPCLTCHYLGVQSSDVESGRKLADCPEGGGAATFRGG